MKSIGVGHPRGLGIPTRTTCHQWRNQVHRGIEVRVFFESAKCFPGRDDRVLLDSAGDYTLFKCFLRFRWIRHLVNTIYVLQSRRV